MAVPKKKPSRHRTHQRRTAWAKKFKLPHLFNCPECGKLKMPHRVCPHCGQYRGEKVLSVKRK